MSSISDDLRLAELLDFFSPAHLKEIKGEGFDAKWQELKTILRSIDRINVREFISDRMAQQMQEFMELDNKWFQEMDWVEQTDWFCENEKGHYGISVWMRNQFKLIPPFVKQGTKIPENIKKLYAESRSCFIFKQYSAAIVLSRAIIEIALKKKIGLSEESRDWTAGRILESEETRKSRESQKQGRTPNFEKTSTGKSPHEILSVKSGASLDEISAAYHRMAQLYQPDKVATLAAEFRELAELRMKEINAAYEVLKKQI